MKDKKSIAPAGAYEPPQADTLMLRVEKGFAESIPRSGSGSLDEIKPNIEGGWL